MTCPICSDWKYKSLVKTCPICGGAGGLSEVRDLAEDFLKQFKSWDRPYPCPNSGELGWEPKPLAELDAIYRRSLETSVE